MLRPRTGFAGQTLPSGFESSGDLLAGGGDLLGLGFGGGDATVHLLRHLADALDAVGQIVGEFGQFEAGEPNCFQGRRQFAVQGIEQLFGSLGGPTEFFERRNHRAQNRRDTNRHEQHRQSQPKNRIHALGLHSYSPSPMWP